MLNLPDIDDLKGETVLDLAASLYPNITYDTALPQQWVDSAVARGFDPRGHVIWLYPQGCLFGHPAPITAEGALGLGQLVARL